MSDWGPDPDSRRALQRISELVSRMQENFTGIRVVKAYHMEAAESERFRAMNQQYFRAVIKALRAELLMTPMTGFVGTACACGFLVYCYAYGIKLDSILLMGGAAILGDGGLVAADDAAEIVVLADRVAAMLTGRVRQHG